MSTEVLDDLIPLPYRFLFAFVVFAGLALWDWKKNPRNPTKYKEYLFLVVSAVVAILFAEIHDAITVRISPDYFIRGKGLGSDQLGWKVAQLAVLASYWVGLVLGLAFLFANNPYKKFPRLKHRQLVKFMSVPLLGALLLGPLFGIWFWLTEKELEPRFAFVWGVHNGSYLGAALGAIVGVVLILRARKFTFESLARSSGKTNHLDRLLLAVLVLSLGYELFAGLLPDDWFLDLVSHFRWARLAGIIAIATVLCVRTSRNLAFTWAGVLGISFFLVMMSDSVASRFENAGATAELQVISFNLLTSNLRTADTVRWIEGNLNPKAPNIVFLMEVNRGWMRELGPLKKRLPYTFESPEEHNFGFAVFSDVPLVNTRLSVFDNSGIEAAQGWVELGGKKIRFLGVHTLPPASEDGFQFRNSFLVNLAESVRKYSSPTIVMGDLNSTPWSKPILRLLEEKNNGGRPLLFATDRKFVRSPTWFGLGSLLAIPIDYVLHTEELEATSFFVGPDLGSDHRPVLATFRVMK